MAEIPVQPKRGMPAWVWVVAVLVVLAVLWFVLGHRSTTPTTGTGHAVPTLVASGLATHATTVMSGVA